MSIQSIVVKIKRAESPLFAALKSAARFVRSFQLPLPRMLYPVFRTLHTLQVGASVTWTRLMTLLYRHPVFQSHCEFLGKRLFLERVPDISGPARIIVGDDVSLSGHISISGARIFDHPELRIGNRSYIAHGCVFAIAKLIIIEDDVLIAGHCYMTDYAAHPKDPARRAAGEQGAPDQAHPIRIRRGAWIGRGAIILPGVTIGEGAIVGAGAVVAKDVPGGATCVGNPGKVLIHDAVESR